MLLNRRQVNFKYLQCTFNTLIAQFTLFTLWFKNKGSLLPLAANYEKPTPIKTGKSELIQLLPRADTKRIDSKCLRNWHIIQVYWLSSEDNPNTQTKISTGKRPSRENYLLSSGVTAHNYRFSIQFDKFYCRTRWLKYLQ